MNHAETWLDGWNRWYYGGMLPASESLADTRADAAAALLDEPVLQRVVGEIAVGRQLELFHDA